MIALTYKNGSVKTTYSYDPFGNVTISGEASDNPFQYTGRENDGTGLYYYRARYYSPKLQRFISEDPLKLTSGTNFFAYVSNNPVNSFDPSGKISEGAAVLMEKIADCMKGAVSGAAGEALLELGKCCYDQCGKKLLKCDLSKCKLNLCNVAVSSLASCIASAAINAPFPTTWSMAKPFLQNLGLKELIKEFGKYGCK